MTEENSQTVQEIHKSWVQNKLKTLWVATKFCGLCLEDQGDFTSLEMELVISNQSTSKCLLDIINYVFSEDIQNITSSPYLCDHCTEKAIQSYLFIHNTRQLSKLVSNCVADIYSKVVDIDEGIDKIDSNSNVVIVLECDENLYKTVNMCPIMEIMPVKTPIVQETNIKPIVEEIVNIGHLNTTEMTELDKIEIIDFIKKEKDTPNRSEEKIPITPVIPERKNEKTIETIKDTQKEAIQIKEPKDHIILTPNISLQAGHIVIKPLTISKSTAVPKYNVYECKSCPGTIFTSYRLLKEHEKAKHKTKIYSCDLCDKVYNTAQYLSIHYRSHNKAKCKLCKTFVPDDELMEHLKTVHSEAVFPCQFCDLVYYTKEALETHFKVIHLVNVTKYESQCVMCLKNFPESHLNKHKCKFACSECFIMPCFHHEYLTFFREQVMNHITAIKCVHCDYTTKRKEHLIAHANREHLDHHPFTCDDCGQQFYTKLSLKMHIVQFHQDLKCPYCDYDFKDHNTMETHKKACKTVTRRFGCDLCVASFDSAEELSSHELLRHKGGGFSCTLCKLVFITELELKEHHAKVHGGIQVKKRRKHIECSLCNVMFNNVKELLAHEQLHDSLDTYPCKVCPKKFTSLWKLYLHNHRHYTIRIRCKGCNKRISASHFKQHAVVCPASRASHLSYVCEKCGKSFHLESLLKNHLKSHGRPIPCPICKKLVKPANLKRHVETLHGNLENIGDIIKTATKTSYECELCCHIMWKRTDLEAHMNRFHLKIKPYKCSVCNKDFCGIARLKEHMATHRTDNSVLCQECGKKFANRVCLKMHNRIHTGEMPYACDLCDQKFRSSSMMKSHRLKKHLEKTVSCPICGHMFHTVRDMRVHFKKSHWKHKDQPFDPTLVEDLSPEFYHLFEDGRLPKLTDRILGV